MDHDTGCRFLLLWSFAEEKRSQHDISQHDDCRGGIVPGAAGDFIGVTSSHPMVVVLLGVLFGVQRNRW